MGQRGVRVRPLGGSRAREVRLGRFLHNSRVTPEAMVATAACRTAGRAQGRHVLVIQDTTSLRDDGDRRHAGRVSARNSANRQRTDLPNACVTSMAQWLRMIGPTKWASKTSDVM